MLQSHDRQRRWQTLLTAQRWQTPTDSPTVRGVDPLRSVLSGSVEAKTVKSSTNVMKNSTPNAWWCSRSGCGMVAPRAPRY